MRVLQKQDDLLVVLPTGAGKSALFFIPAMVEGDEPLMLVSVVVVPLVSLTSDMMRRANQHNISCETWKGTVVASLFYCYANLSLN